MTTRRAKTCLSRFVAPEATSTHVHTCGEHEDHEDDHACRRKRCGRTWAKGRSKPPVSKDQAIRDMPPPPRQWP